VTLLQADQTNSRVRLVPSKVNHEWHEDQYPPVFENSLVAEASALMDILLRISTEEPSGRVTFPGSLKNNAAIGPKHCSTGSGIDASAEMTEV
jgi:hypothetical protein